MGVFVKATLALIFTLCAALGSYALLAALGPDWSRFAPATCRATHCFCELPRVGQLILQPANSWSSFGFVVLGSWIILAQQPRNAFAGTPAIWFGVTAIFIGVGSFLLHATLTLWGQFLDVFGMYLTGAFLIAWAVKRWSAWSDGQTILLYLVLVAILTLSLIAVPETRRWLFAAVLLAAIVIETVFARPHRPGIDARWYGAGIALQILAFVIWTLDLTRTLCENTTLLQGHAIWHLLNAAAMACSWRYFTSERMA
jgi:hypothetical protein